MAALVDDGTVSTNAMRRGVLNDRTRDAIQKGTQTECDPFWLAKLRAGALWITSSAAPTPNEPLATPTLSKKPRQTK